MKMTKSEALTIGHRTSDFFAKLVRSWRFVLFQLTLITFWIILNKTKTYVWDPYPFDMLKLILTIEASFMGSMILMSQNGQSEKDRQIIYDDYVIDQKIRRDQKIDREKIDQVLEILKSNMDLKKQFNLDLLPKHEDKDVVDIIELVSEKVHDSWMESKKAAGVSSRKLESGEELMVPYNKLSEEAKNLDRNMVRTTFEAIKMLGLQ